MVEKELMIKSFVVTTVDIQKEPTLLKLPTIFFSLLKKLWYLTKHLQHQERMVNVHVYYGMRKRLGTRNGIWQILTLGIYGYRETEKV